MKQRLLLKNEPKAYGGELLKTRKGRSRGRPLDTKNSTHMVLRSSKAKGEWSFLRPKNARAVREIFTRFSRKYGVKVVQLVNVGNHLHVHIKLTNRHTYKPFIRAVTGAIAMAITGRTRWNPTAHLKSMSTKTSGKEKTKLKFWDYRPFTRVVMGWRAILTLKDYLKINELEGRGYSRATARNLLQFKPKFSSG